MILDNLILLETTNPNDLSINELSVAAKTIEADLHLTTLVAGASPEGVGNRFLDELLVYLPNVEFFKDSAFTLLGAHLLNLMRKRFRRAHESKRHRQITYMILVRRDDGTYGGRVLGKAILTEESADPLFLDLSNETEGLRWVDTVTIEDVLEHYKEADT